MPPASTALNRKVSSEDISEKGGTTPAPRATVAFAQEKEGFDIPTAEEILSREEHPTLFSDFIRSLPSSVTKVCPRDVHSRHKQVQLNAFSTFRQHVVHHAGCCTRLQWGL